MEALTKIKIAIFKVNHPENKPTKGNQDLILHELGMVSCSIPDGELPQVRSFRLETDILICVC
jgi:hypothetical protein